MHVEQPKLQVQHGLAGDAKPKVSGLDDARVHGSHRDLEHAFASHGPERVEVPADARDHRVAGKSLRSAHAPSGQSSWSATRAGFGWPSGMSPKKSMTSRSNQFAAGCFAAIEG